MSASFEVSGNNTKIIFEYETTTEIMQDIVKDASHYLWKKVEGSSFEDLSNQEKLDLVDEHVKLVIKNLANTYKSIKAQEFARELESEDEYEIN